MSWASRRRATYLFGVVLFFGIVFGGPLAYWYFSIPTTCFDGTQNQGESAPDKGGPCKLLDERTLTAHSILWSRSFSVRPGAYNAVAYIENPNQNAGVKIAPYRFKLYDEKNVLVAERVGATFVMPGTITPIFEGEIDAGTRKVSRTFFEFSAPLVWERMYDTTTPLVVQSKDLTDANTTPRLAATVENRAVSDMRDITFIAVVFDTAGNAFAASSTVVPLIKKGERREIVFTWPDPFQLLAGRIDVLPSLAPSDTK